MADAPTSSLRLLAKPVACPIAVERWADLTRALALYPDTNSRVLGTLAPFLESLREANAPALEIVFSSDAVHVGGERFAIPSGGGLCWLRDRLDRADLAGASFSPGVTEESVVAFSKDLLEAYRRQDLDARFAALWSKGYAGIAPIERRFDGVFGGAGGDAGESAPPTAAAAGGEPPPGLSTALNGDDAIRARVEAIHARVLARHGHEGEFRRIDLVGEIVARLPVEASHDATAARRMTEQVLATIEERLVTGELAAALLAQGGDAAFRQLLFVISRLHFRPDDGGVQSRQAPAPRREVARPLVPAPATAAGPAQGFDDDAAEVLAEIDALGPPIRGPLRPEQVEDAAEQLGVMLHHLALDGDAGPADPLWAEVDRLAETGSDAVVQVLRSHLEPRERGDAPPPGHEALAARLFGLPRKELTPLLRRLWEGDRRRYRDAFAAHLRATVAPPLDHAILDVGLDAGFLLSDYLAALSSCDREKTERQRIVVLQSALTAAGKDADRIARHVRAIEMLASFDGGHTRAYLTRVLREREMPFVPKHPRPIRKAASRVLRSLRRDRSSRRV